MRELENVIERAVVLCNGNVITADDLPGEKFGAAPLERSSAPGVGIGEQQRHPEFEAERTRIMNALEQHRG